MVSNVLYFAFSSETMGLVVQAAQDYRILGRALPRRESVKFVSCPGRHSIGPRGNKLINKCDERIDNVAITMF